MSEQVHQFLLWLTGGSAFGLVFSIWLMVLVAWYVRRSAEEDRVQTRLGLRRAHENERVRVLRLWRDGEVITTLVPGRSSFKATVALHLEEAQKILGWEVPLAALILGHIGFVILCFAAVLGASGEPLFAIGVAAVVILGPWTAVRYHIKQRMALLERQFVDALGLAARSLRAGHPLIGACRLVAEEMEPPVKTIFADILQEQALGVSMEEAIRARAEESSYEDLKLFAASVIIQWRSGGNLADMMERLAVVIRDRMRLHRRARILTSQTQLSKRILVGVPFFIMASLYVLSPDYLMPLFTTLAGNILLIVAALLLLTGAWIMNRIAKLRY